MASLGTCGHMKHVDICQRCEKKRRAEFEADPPHVHHHLAVFTVTVCSACGQRREWRHPEPKPPFSHSVKRGM